MRGWLIVGYGGLTLSAAGIDLLLGPAHWSRGTLLTVLGIALAAIGFAQGLRRVAQENDRSA